MDTLRKISDRWSNCPAKLSFNNSFFQVQRRSKLITCAFLVKSKKSLRSWSRLSSLRKSHECEEVTENVCETIKCSMTSANAHLGQFLFSLQLSITLISQSSRNTQPNLRLWHISFFFFSIPNMHFCRAVLYGFVSVKKKPPDCLHA
jgi:hypothetical protein